MQLYNTLNQKKETFSPIVPNTINLYVCGITVYDLCHIGHAKVLVFFDFFVKFLKSQNWQVNYIRNITDIDDKIFARAQEKQINYRDLVEQFINEMNQDSKILNITPPDKEPRVIDHIDKIIELIQKIIDNGYAYQTSEGNVYFDILKFKEYGKLSKKKIEDLLDGVRKENKQDKKNNLDFALWKKSLDHEAKWDAPWGKGRPGWHIECSAMSCKYLGDNFDIHGGGMDLIFPHHENEIAQSECANQSKFANYWMHVGSLMVDDKKMSKSLGNFITIKDVLKDYHPEVLRIFLLSAHYRQPINFSKDVMKNWKNSLNKLYNSIENLIPITPTEKTLKKNKFYLEIIGSLNDDFNTPQAYASIFNLSRELNILKTKDINQANELAGILIYVANLFGFLQLSTQDFNEQTFNLSNNSTAIDSEQIETLIEQRNEARNDKNWQLADKLRDKLDVMGVILEDKQGKTYWKFKL